MKRILPTLLGAAFLLLVVAIALRSLAVVDETQYVLITEFGRPVAVYGDEPGESGTRPAAAASARRSASGRAPVCEITSAAQSPPSLVLSTGPRPCVRPKRSPAANRSPAPVVSTTRSTAAAGTSSGPRAVRTVAPRAPRVMTTSSPVSSAAANASSYEWTPSALADVAEWGLTWHLGHATAPSVAKAAIAALGMAATDTAVIHLERLGAQFGNRKSVRSQLDDAVTTGALEPVAAKALYEQSLDAWRAAGVVRVEAGEFAADMAVELVNDGPVTILLDSRKGF